jgi:hypothetical protein
MLTVAMGQDLSKHLSIIRKELDATTYFVWEVVLDPEAAATSRLSQPYFLQPPAAVFLWLSSHIFHQPFLG